MIEINIRVDGVMVSCQIKSNPPKVNNVEMAQLLMELEIVKDKILSEIVKQRQPFEVKP